MKKVITVGICTKNSEATIGHALESVGSQDFPLDNLELLLVDSGSRDKTLDIVNDFLRRTKVEGRFFSDSGAGLSTARQIILDNAQGRYILWLDSDVILAPDFVKQQLIFLKDQPRMGLVRGKGLFKESNSLVANVQNLLFCQLEAVFFGATVSVTEALRQTGGFDKRIKGASEDVDIKTRMLIKGWYYSINSYAFFVHTPKETLRRLFKQYSWYGYGDHFLYHKYDGLVKIPYRTLPLFFAWGLKLSKKSYENNGKLKSFLVPTLCSFISLCWGVGFIKAHFEEYGHLIKKPEIKKETLLFLNQRKRCLRL